MDVPPDDHVRNNIKQFFRDHSGLGGNVLISKYRDSMLKSVTALAQEGVSQDEIDQRVKRSNRIFSEELSRTYHSSSSGGFEDQLPQSYIPLASNQASPMPLIVALPRITPEERAERKANRDGERKAQAASLAAAYKKAVDEVGPIQDLSQADVIQMIARKGYRMSNSLKALLVCVSYDEDRIRQTCIDIVRYLNPNLRIPVEFFCVNPELYRSAREGHQIWIDRAHYFQVSFGNPVDPREHADLDRLMRNGPYDFVIYAGCPIYSNPDVGYNVGSDMNTEGQQLNAIMRSDSVLVIYPFNRIPVYATLRLRSVGIDLVGRSTELFEVGNELSGYEGRPIGIYMKEA